MKILVTGAAGLIGSAVCDILAKNHYVVAIDNYSRGEAQPDCSEFIKENLSEVDPDNDFDIIFHFAAVNGTTNFYTNPTNTLINNISSDIAAFNIAKKQNKLSKFVYASTSELVHNSSIVPTPEITNIGFNNSHDPRWSYCIPKLAIENLLINSDLPVLILRYFNVFGTNTKSGHFVYDQIEKIKKGVFEIIGASETRSYCYIDDAASATVQLAESAATGVVNVGNDRELSTIDAANIIATALGHALPNWTYLPGRSGSTARRCPDINKLKKYIPDYNPLSFEKAIMFIVNQNK